MPTVKKFSYNNILGPEIVSAAMAIREDLSQARWDIGDMALSILRMHEAAVDGFTAKDIAKAVAAFTGLRTVEVIEMMRMSAKFNQEERDRHPALSWGYFQRALLFGGQSNQVLEWAEAQLDELNRPASLDAVTVVLKAPDPAQANAALPIEEAKKATKIKSVKALHYVASRIQTGAIELPSETSTKALKLVEVLVNVINPEDKNGKDTK